VISFSVLLINIPQSCPLMVFAMFVRMLNSLSLSL
jgi:hypothetical protein